MNGQEKHWAGGLLDDPRQFLCLASTLLFDIASQRSERNWSVAPEVVGRYVMLLRFHARHRKVLVNQNNLIDPAVWQAVGEEHGEIAEARAEVDDGCLCLSLSLGCDRERCHVVCGEPEDWQSFPNLIGPDREGKRGKGEREEKLK